MTRSLFALVLVLLAPTVGNGRLSFLDTLWRQATGMPPVVRVGAGEDLQAALNTAPEGAVIMLARGARYTGTFILPAHGSTQPKTLTTEGALPEGRVTPESSGQLAILQSPSNKPALMTAAGARYWRVSGLEVAPNGSADGTAIEIGSATAKRVEDLAADIVLDRLLVRGDATKGQKRGVALHGSALTLTRSYVSEFKRHGMDTQAVYANNGPGPYTITDNYLEASGENVLFGGDTPRIEGLVPADILIEGNTISKPLSWRQEKWNVKNLLELKNARRVVVRRNVFSGNWVSAQAGYALLVSPRNQYGRAPWTVVEDVLFEGNVIKDVSSGFKIAGDDSEHPSRRTRGIVIRQNLVVADSARFGGVGRFMMIGRSPQQITIEQNTCVCSGSSWIYTYGGGDVLTSEGLVVRNNVAEHNRYGFMGQKTRPGRRTLEAYYPDAVFEGNVLAGGNSAAYPQGNFFPAVSELQQEFVDSERGDYRLKRAGRLAGRGIDLPALGL